MCLMVAMTTLVGACATRAAPESELFADPREPVQEMLQERARRLTAGDVEGYLRPMTPEARAVEEPKPTTRATIATNSDQFTAGT